MDRSKAALAYIQEGYSVLPVLAGDKRPATEWKEYQERYAADEEIAEWWKRWPDANVGIITGKISGLSVIDVDGLIGIDSINKQPIKPPTTRVINTPHGWHLYYQYRKDWHTGAGFLPGIDIRSDGGYVVAPPSVVDGKEYTVFRPNPVAVITLPISAFQQHSRGAGTSPGATVEGDRPTWVRDALEHGAGEKTRNDTATRLIGYFHSLGTPRDIIEVLLTDFTAKCQPPMDIRELHASIESVTRYQTKVKAARIAEVPVFQDEGDSYLYTWSQHAVSIRLSNLDSGKDGLHSEVTIEAGPPGIPPIIYGPTRFNLVSTPARTALVKYMADRYPLDWAGILEAVSRLAVMEIRDGEPIIDLKDYIASATKWLIFPFVLEDQPTFLFADGGTGKSLFALALLLCIQLQTPELLGRIPSRGVRGLYLDWEATPQEHNERYRFLLNGVDIDHSTVNVLYRRCDTPLVDQVATLRRYIVEKEIGFVVVDSVVAACSGEAEHSDTARQFFNALRKLRVPTLCISHTTKENDTSHKPFGSTFWNNLARNTWEMRKVQDTDESTMSIALYNRKVNAGKLHKPIGYTIHFREDAITFTSGDVMNVPEFASQQPVQFQIADLLRHSSMTVKDLAEALTKKPDVIRMTLNRYKGMFHHFPASEQGKEPVWGMTSKREEPF